MHACMSLSVFITSNNAFDLRLPSEKPTKAHDDCSISLSRTLSPNKAKTSTALGVPRRIPCMHAVEKAERFVTLNPFDFGYSRVT